MLSVFVCENDKHYQKKLLGFIHSHIGKFDMEITLCTKNPIKIIRHIENTKVHGLYFLELGGKTDGLEAAKLIRKHDPRGFIVFIATNPDYMPLTFEHKVEALSYIQKTDEKTVCQKIGECIEDAYHKHVSRPNDGCYIFKGQNGQRISCCFDDILFFETESPSSKRVILHTKKRQYIFYNTFGEIIKELPIGLFFHCHKSYIVNVGNLTEDRKSVV
jgi:two-component system response regulator AgrA